MKKEKLKKYFNITANNFKFVLGEDFEILFDIIFEKVKNSDEKDIAKKFQQIWLIPSQEWNKKYGYSGYPALADWIELLAGKRPLNDYEIESKRKQHENTINNILAEICCWINDQNLDISFKNKYQNPENIQKRIIIDKFFNLKRELNTDEIMRMGRELRRIYLEDKVLFRSKIKQLAIEEKPLLLE